MNYFCTYFDRNYLTRGLALYESLRTHAGRFDLTILCMDADTKTELSARNLPEVRLVELTQLIEKYPSLAAAQRDRSKLEFYFTCTSWLMLDALAQVPSGDLITYLDSDLYFFSSPRPIYDEIREASVAITPHRFPPSLSHLERYGKFNVGWVSMRNDSVGHACASDWASKCAAWCFNQLENDRYADQKYLDAWTESFPPTHAIAHPGVNVAPWNIADALVEETGGSVRVNDHPLIFYHFHALRPIEGQLYDPSLYKYNATLTPGLRNLVYIPYLNHLIAAQPSAAPVPPPDLLPLSDPRDPRAGVALTYLLDKLQSSELDRAERLQGIEAIENDRNLARADLDKVVRYAKDLEKDSAERLASIHFYQEKLKTAYADLERNVAYLKTLEAEIAAHVKVSADKDAIIAQLHAQLSRAPQPPPAAT